MFLVGKLKHAPLLVMFMLMSVACNHRKVPVQQTIEEPAPSLASTIHMGDPKAAGQLISGFYDIENRSWRWTARQFSVMLRTPPGSVQKGAILTLNVTVPAVALQPPNTLSLSASVNGNTLPAETWSKPGGYVYRRDLPANLLTGDSARVDFMLDHAIPPGEKDARELGVVVTKAGLVLK